MGDRHSVKVRRFEFDSKVELGCLVSDPQPCGSFSDRVVIFQIASSYLDNAMQEIDGSLDGELAFLYTKGKLRNLGTLGGRVNAGYGINASGLVSGCSANADGVMIAFVYTNGRMIHLNSSFGLGCLDLQD